MNIVSRRENALYYCGYCNVKTNKMSNIRDHLRTHNGSRPFKCLICTQDFKQKGQLTKHKKTKVHNDKLLSFLKRLEHGPFQKSPQILFTQSHFEGELLKEQMVSHIFNFTNDSIRTHRCLTALILNRAKQ